MTDDPFIRYRRSALGRRTLDTLIGISKGIVADGEVNQLEAQALLTFLRESEQAGLDHPITDRLLDRVGDMLTDGVLDGEEAAELHELLVSFSGGMSAWGEVSKPATLPLDQPAPRVAFEGRSFLFTGVCMYGARKVCQRAVEARGGTAHNTVNLRTNYLVIGSYVTASWKHQSFGLKIEKAMDYRDNRRTGLAIISEEHWHAALEGRA